MCGITGFVSIEEALYKYRSVLENMTDSLNKRGPDDRGLVIYKNAALGHRRLIVVDPKGGRQPMIKKKDKIAYTIIYNGELYNTEDVRAILLKKGYTFNSYSDTEVLLTAYIEWKEDCLKYINGIFAFAVWEEGNHTLFLARDPLGVKPLFYSIAGNTIIFGSEIKALLKHPLVKSEIGEEGLLEIFALGPARSPGVGIFNGIKEIPPANYLIFNREGIKLKEYWKLTAEHHQESFEETAENVRSLLTDAVERQLIGDVNLCTFLSGGLDSSAISSIASSYFKRNNKGILNTFSIDYEGNDKYFEKNIFEPSSDSKYAGIMVDYIKSSHENVVENNYKLMEALKDAVIANDLPGMADVDSSLYLFCREVKKKATIALSGECADEIFGGYPWFRYKNIESLNTFPWANSSSIRKSILNGSLKKLKVDEYIREKYEDTLREVPKLQGESFEESRMREMFYLNVKWFMITLLNRKDRMSMRNSLEVRVPFADYRIVEYAFNIPNKMKFYKGREKGLLREALKGLLPEEILMRKKSPYPKTHNPEYTRAVQDEMKVIINNNNSPINDLIDKNQVLRIIGDPEHALSKPWYGQLMTGPQVLAYLIQINTWLINYKIKIK